MAPDDVPGWQIAGHHNDAPVSATRTGEADLPGVLPDHLGVVPVFGKSALTDGLAAVRRHLLSPCQAGVFERLLVLRMDFRSA